MGWAIALAAAMGAGGAAAIAALWPEDPDRLYARALAAVEAGRWDHAQAALERSARLRRPTAADCMLRARLELALGRDEAALAAMSRVPDDDPRGAGARLRRGQLELRKGLLRAAEADLRRSVELNPMQALARRELVYLYGMQRRREELEEQFVALAALMPLTFDDVLVWSLACGLKSDPREVVADLSRSVEADPEDRWSRLALAEMLEQQGRFDDAEAALALLPPADAEARTLRARLAVDRGDVAAAAALVSEGPAGHAGLARLCGRLALHQGDWGAATRHFQAALAVEPAHRDALYGLALGVQQAAGPAAARPFLAAARAQDVLNQRLEHAARDGNRDDPKMLLDLGAACEAVGRLSQARAWYRLVIARDPLDSQAQRALFRLGMSRHADRTPNTDGPSHPAAMELRHGVPDPLARWREPAR
jgi:tetratricopeptide (TPR) repeat protein